MLVAELGGPTMFARIGVMRALNRHVERVFDPSRKDSSLGPPEAGEGSMIRCGPTPSVLRGAEPNRASLMSPTRLWTERATSRDSLRDIKPQRQRGTKIPPQSYLGLELRGRYE